jgi:hypothetical protein
VRSLKSVETPPAIFRKEGNLMGAGGRGKGSKKRVSKKAMAGLRAARAARGGAGRRRKTALPPAATSASATDVSRELEASPGADQSAEFGMGIS